MNKEDTEKNPQKFCTTKIPIPAYNDYLLKDMKHWMKKIYHQVYIKVGWRKAGKIKGIMPIETAAYAEDKVFGNWRLVAPDGPGKISPLQQAIEWLRPFIEIASLPLVARNDVIARSGATKQSQVTTRWGEFRCKFGQVFSIL